VIYIFDLPVGTSLGQNENCFDHVQVKAFDVEHGLDITPKKGAVLFQPTGKLVRFQFLMTWVSRLTWLFPGSVFFGM